MEFGAVESGLMPDQPLRARLRPLTRADDPSGNADERTFVMTRGLAEGTETIVAHALLVALPGSMVPIAWTFAAMVAVTILQRVALARRHLA